MLTFTIWFSLLLVQRSLGSFNYAIKSSSNLNGLIDFGPDWTSSYYYNTTIRRYALEIRKDGSPNYYLEGLPQNECKKILFENRVEEGSYLAVVGSSDNLTIYKIQNGSLVIEYDLSGVMYAHIIKFDSAGFLFVADQTMSIFYRIDIANKRYSF